MKMVKAVELDRRVHTVTQFSYHDFTTAVIGTFVWSSFGGIIVTPATGWVGKFNAGGKLLGPSL